MFSMMVQNTVAHDNDRKDHTVLSVRQRSTSGARVGIVVLAKTYRSLKKKGILLLSVRGSSVLLFPVIEHYNYQKE